MRTNRGSPPHVYGGAIEASQMKRLYLEHRQVEEVRDLDSVVATFDDDCFLEEQNDEWAVGRRYFSSESMAKLTQPSAEEVVETLLALESA